MTMSRGCWLLHLLLVWCSLERLVCVNAQMVTITKASPVGDPVEGNPVELRCQATNLTAGNIIEWTRMETREFSIARNGMILDYRYTLSTSTSSGAQNKVEIITFLATKEDTAVVYGCRVRDSVETNSTSVVEAQPLSFTVLYFPSAMYPICIPDGPFTVQEGTTVNMSCTTEIGNPPVQKQILTSSVVYAWDYDRDTKEQIRSLQLSVTGNNDGGSYQCQINPDSTGSTPFTGMNRSCTIGPITVVPMTTENTPNSNTPIASDLSNNPTTVPPSTTPDLNEATAWPDDTTTTVSPPTTSFPIAIIAGAAGGGGLLIVLLIILLILYLCKCGCFKKDKQHPTLWQTNVPLTESNDHHEPWGKHSGSIGQDVEKMREINPTPGFIEEPETENALEMKDMETSAGGDVVYAQPRKKSTSKEQNKDKIGRPQGTGATGVDAEDAGAEVDETGGGESPPDGKVQKTKNKPQHKEERMSEDDHAELWQSTDPPPGLIEDNYTEIPNMTAIDPGLKPTAVVKPVVHPTVSKPEDDLQSSPHSNDGVSPSVGDKPIIKKFQPKDRSVSQPQRGGCNPNRATSSAEQPQSTDDWSPPIEQHGHTPQDDPNEEARYAEVSHNYAQPHEATTPDDHHDITYAELDLNPPTSDAKPQPKEDQTLYASIVMD
ncbi:uncharacterized protein [Asterias amurensis]|uniref:uncharacterized protein n=1 Tax=Asterias amurensis TaxID=7602 RepID=UPI003AB1B5D0